MIEVRPARPGDAAAIRAVHEAAFPTIDEADLVERLAADGDAAVSLVAEADGELIGHVMLSRMFAVADGAPLRALGLAPIGVLPDRQKQGVGSALTEVAITEAREQGAEIIFVLGEPDYYSRFGFAVAEAAPYASPYAGPWFQAMRLDQALLPPAEGAAAYAPAFARLAQDPSPLGGEGGAHRVSDGRVRE